MVVGGLVWQAARMSGRWFLLLVVALLPAAARADAVFRCVNPASGAAWELRVDVGRATVNGSPASIGPARIVWRDAADGAHDTLDRRSGTLVVVRGSSTGGWMQRARCVRRGDGAHAVGR